MAFGPADRDGTNQNKDRTAEGSVSQIVGHRPGRHFPIITGPSNRHNHYQRQLGVCRLTVGKLTGLPVVMLPVCRGWACPVGGFLGYCMRAWVLR